MIFQNIQIQFKFEDDIISGHLNGDIHKWCFSTTLNTFLKYFPEGEFNNKMMMVVDDHRLDLIESVLNAIDEVVKINQIQDPDRTDHLIGGY